MTTLKTLVDHKPAVLAAVRDAGYADIKVCPPMELFREDGARLGFVLVQAEGKIVGFGERETLRQEISSLLELDIEFYSSDPSDAPAEPDLQYLVDAVNTSISVSQLPNSLETASLEEQWAECRAYAEKPTAIQGKRSPLTDLFKVTSEPVSKKAHLSGSGHTPT